MNCIPLEINSVIPRLNWSPRRLTHRLCSGHSHLFPTLVFMACATAWATADKLPGVTPAWPCFARVTVANPHVSYGDAVCQPVWNDLGVHRRSRKGGNGVHGDVDLLLRRSADGVPLEKFSPDRFRIELLDRNGVGQSADCLALGQVLVVLVTHRALL